MPRFVLSRFLSQVLQPWMLVGRDMAEASSSPSTPCASSTLVQAERP